VPHYIALSYVWGDPTITRSGVIVNGIDYQVTSNLETALRHLRAQSGGAPRTCWVDAICINQQDVGERNRQVAIMQSIFSNASKVVAWLGTSTASSEHAMSYLARFQDIPPLAESVRNFLTAMSGDTWSAIQELLRRPWFYRIWLIQEMAVGRDVEIVCGRQSFPWSVLELIESAYATHGSDIYSETSSFWQAQARDQDVNRWEGMIVAPHAEPPHSPGLAEFSQFVLASGALTMMLAIRRRYKEGRLLNFFEFLIATRFYQCTDPRDRIYSFMGMFASQEAADAPPRPVVDYMLPFDEICVNWSRYWLLKSRNLDLLSCVDSSPESTDRKLPSWALDVTRLVQSLDQGEWFRPYDTETPRLYKATSSSIARPLFADSGSTLILSGVEVGRVNVLGEPSPDAIRNMAPDAFWRTVLADQERPPFGYPQRLGERRLEQEDVNSLLAHTYTDPSYLRIRTFFVSSEGLIGLCPRYTEPGDQIVLFRGGRLPFIIREVDRSLELRSLDDTARHYRLIGEA
jgi:Heterokaryon incompatibility protein (HET)